jgi:hypothetical protein
MSNLVYDATEQGALCNWLNRMGPAHFGHISFRGVMRFGIEPFAQSLINDHTGSARQLRLA